MTASELNAWDRRLLDRYLPFYDQLASGAREPRTAAQAHFVRVCRGGATPATQHEIAYIKYLKARPKVIPAEVNAQSKIGLPPSPGYETTADPTSEAIEVVDAIEEATLSLSRWSMMTSGTLERLRDLYRRGRSNAHDRLADAALWTSTILSDAEFVRGIERWMGDVFNRYSDAATAIMDGIFGKTGPVAGDPSTQPLWHRFFEGHTPAEAWSAVCEAFPDKNAAETFIHCLKVLGSDMASTAGLPIVQFTREGYDSYIAFIDGLGLSRAFAADLLSINLTEILAGTIPTLAAILNWNAADVEKFGQLVGSFGVAAAYSANPLMAIISIVMLARAFHMARSDGNQGSWAKAIAEGGSLTGIIFVVSAAIAGPAWVGLITGICVMLTLKHCKRPAASAIDAAAISRLIKCMLRKWLPAPRRYGLPLPLTSNPVLG